MSNQLEIALRENKLLKNYDISSFDLSGVKGNLLSIKEGEIIYRSDEKVKELFLIISGEVNLIMRDESKEIKSMMKSANDYFGDEHLFSDNPPESTAVALSDCYLIILSKDEVDNLLEQKDKTDDPKIEMDASEEEAEPETQPESTPKVEPDTYFDSDSAIENADVEIEKSEEIERPINDSERSNLSEVDETNEDESEVALEENIKPESNADQMLDAMVDDDDMEDLREFLADEKSLSEFEVEEYRKSAQLIDKPWTYDPKEKESLANEENKKNVFDDTNESGNKVDSLSEEESANLKSDAHENSLKNQELQIESKEDQDHDAFERTMDELEKGEEPIEDDSEKIDIQEFVELSEQLAQLEKDQKRLFDKSQILDKSLLQINSSIYLEDTLKNILDAFDKVAPCEKVTLYMVDKESEREWNRINGLDESQLRLNIDDSFAKEVLNLKKVLNVKDTQSGENGNYNYRTTESSKSVIGLPLLDPAGTIIAVILLVNRKDGYFTDEDEAMLSVLSNHSAQAILNSERAGHLLKTENLISVRKLTYFLDDEFRKKVYLTKSYLEGIGKSDRNDDDAKVVKTAYSSAKEMHYSLNRIFAFADERPHLYLTRQNLNSVIQEFINNNQSFIRDFGAEIVFDSGIDVDVKIDLNEFNFVLKAIIKNACEALTENKQIRIESDRDKQTININIIDYGIGISESAYPSVFDPFYSNGKENASGLGLSISQKIVEDHNGKLTVKSDPQTGTKFTISLPIAASY
ncbi:MAG: cyclic nucleotide-binding domain-containing protein [Melioribacteraceae bacterium]|nr:cyclic nucleotide-binding domain-containing protein [Melioribacteraceae bacterium]MCF8263660.1 cyclic nucleotide-binding domain-containing protein [Melioribacteraceae bacterium]MCF8431396.1 cyclic nucleotide-binding domain-containing protein [Melioribacteraceae bacterium]